MKGGGRGSSYTKYTAPLNSGSTGKVKEDDCSISFNTELVNQTAALRTLILDDKLSLQVSSAKVITAYNDIGEACGNIVSVYNKKLIDCIDKGNVFNAILRSITGLVKVERAK